MTSFSDLGLSQETLEILEKKGYVTPSSIQEQTIPLLLNKTCDIMGQSQTGTGKTAAFGLPIIETLLKNENGFDKSIKTLILAPTRELAIQVGNELSSFVGKRKLKVFTVYGGQSYTIEKRHMKEGIDILVGTPGRLIDHMNNGLLDFSKIQYFVLDEADEMLNMGFIDDIEKILQNTPREKTTLFFSATMPKEILNTAKKYMNEFKLLTVKSQHLTNASVEQQYYTVRQSDKVELLSRVIDMEHSFYGIIFCRTKADVDELMNVLAQKGYNVDSIHGDMSQAQREKTFKKFKNGTTKILVATDVAARGLDVSGLSHVINYTIPQNPEDYTHRIGRTGRAGKSGTAITFVTSAEVRRLGFIKNITKADIIQKQVPTVEQVIASQLENVKKVVGEAIDANNYSDYVALAHDLLKMDKGEIVLASVLSTFLKNRLSADKYGDIAAGGFAKSFESSDRGGYDRGNRFDRGSSSRGNRFDRGGDRSGDRGFSERGGFDRGADSVRLFVGKGKTDGMTPRKMVEFISTESGVPTRNIDDMEVFEEFSFFNAPKNVADKLVRHFGSKKYGPRPLITLAKKGKSSR